MKRKTKKCTIRLSILKNCPWNAQFSAWWFSPDHIRENCKEFTWKRPSNFDYKYQSEIVTFLYKIQKILLVLKYSSIYWKCLTFFFNVWKKNLFVKIFKIAIFSPWNLNFHKWKILKSAREKLQNSVRESDFFCGKKLKKGKKRFTHTFDFHGEKHWFLVCMRMYILK